AAPVLGGSRRRTGGRSCGAAPGTVHRQRRYDRRRRPLCHGTGPGGRFAAGSRRPPAPAGVVKDAAGPASSRAPRPQQHALLAPGGRLLALRVELVLDRQDRKSTRLNSSHVKISYAVFCLKKKKKT